MNSKENDTRSFNIWIFLYFFSMILEKLKWNIGGWSCDLFTIVTAIYFLLLIVIHCVKQRKLFIDNVAKSFLSFYFVLGIYVLLQFIIIQKDSTMTTQYFKGVITTAVQIVAVINIVMLFNLNQNRFEFSDLSFIFLVITTINAFYCLLQNINPNIDATLVSLFHSDVSRYGVDSYGTLGRVTGLLLESNFNGPFLVIGFINAIFYLNNYIDANKIGKRAVCLICIILIGVETLLTLSLTTYIGIAVWIAYIVFKSKSKHKTKIIAFLALAVIAVLYVYITNPAIHNVVNTKFSIFGGKQAFQSGSHYRIAVQTVEIFLSNLAIIIFGTGINCLNIYFQRMFGYTIMKAHSYYLQSLCEMGIFGFVICMYYFVISFRYNKYSEEGRFVSVLLLCTLMMNFSYDPFTRNFNYILLGLTVLAYRLFLNRSLIDCIGKDY